MTPCRISFLAASLLTLCAVAFAREPEVAAAPAPEAAAAASALPARWHGHWRGPMTSSVPGGDPQTIEMELHIAPTDDLARCTWTIVYIAGGQRQERPYEIVAVDAGAGKYIIDEKNSIEIEGRMVGDVLHCPFSLGEVLLLATYRLEGESLHVSIVTMDTAEAGKTGGLDGAPQVALPRVRAVQWADLKRE